MKKWYKNKNLWIIATLVVVIAVVFVIAGGGKKVPTPDVGKLEQIDMSRLAALPAAPAGGAPDVSMPEAGAGTQTNGIFMAPGAQAEEAGHPEGYVLCYLPMYGQYGVIALPEEGEVTYPVRQEFETGNLTENILCLTPNGFHMESSNCSNQDCIGQGEVTFENREERILQNQVICLPNQLIVYLYTGDEILSMGLRLPDPAASAEAEDEAASAEPED